VNLLAIALHLDGIAGAFLRGTQGIHPQLVRCLGSGDFAQSHTSIYPAYANGKIPLKFRTNMPNHRKNQWFPR
jgi:hypothetical protein